MMLSWHSPYEIPVDPKVEHKTWHSHDIMRQNKKFPHTDRGETILGVAPIRVGNRPNSKNSDQTS